MDLEDCYFVYAGGPTGTLLISMQGSNEMHGGIEGVNGNLTFGGSGSLKVVSGQEAAVWAGKITVRSGSLTALAVSGGSADAYGLRAMSTLMISGGTVVAGGECTLTVECAGYLYCKVDAARPGKCSPREAAAGACSSNDACESGGRALAHPAPGAGERGRIRLSGNGLAVARADSRLGGHPHVRLRALPGREDHG